MLDEAARVELFRAWKRFAHERAKTFWNHAPWRQRLAGGGQEFEDVLQVVLLAFWRATRAFDPARGVAYSTFAARCARNAVLHLVRKGGGRRATHYADMSRVPAPERDEAEVADLARAVGVKVKTLTPDQAEAMRLRYALGMKMGEAARAEGVSRQAIDQRIQRALAHLRETFNVA